MPLVMQRQGKRVGERAEQLCTPVQCQCVRLPHQFMRRLGGLASMGAQWERKHPLQQEL